MSKPSNNKAARRKKRTGGKARDARRLTDFGIRNSDGQWWPSSSGDNSVTVDCGGCGTSFVMPSGATSIGMNQRAEGGQDPTTITWTAGPCPTCYKKGAKVFGKPRMYMARSADGSSYVIAGTQEQADEWLLGIESIEKENTPLTPEMVTDMMARTDAEPIIVVDPDDAPPVRDDIVIGQSPRISRRERRRHKRLEMYDNDSEWGNTGYNPKEKPWPRGGEWVKECSERLGADFVQLGNWYGHVDGYEDDWFWCLCAGCGKPFQYWGTVAMQYREKDGPPPDVVLGAGPCTHCGGVGKSLEPMVKTTKGGLTMVASSKVFFEMPLWDYVNSALNNGMLDVDGAVEILRSDGRPFYTVIADWIERRQATSMVSATMLAGVLAVVGPQMAADDQPDPGLTEREVVVILEEVLDRYENEHPGPSGEAPQVNVDVDVDENGKGDVDVDVDVDVGRPPA